MEKAKLLVIDNYDSFTHNLVQMFILYDLRIDVFRADLIDLEKIRIFNPDYLLISPGPKDPANAGISMDVIRRFAGEKPLMGVCLGMQCINEVYGGKTVRAPVPVHGKKCRVSHDNTGVFHGMPDPFVAARYHSLAVVPPGTGLAVNARSDDGVIMGISDKANRVFGVQFHPESFLTESGFKLIENFLRSGPLFSILDQGFELEDEQMCFFRYPDRTHGDIREETSL